MTDEDIFSKLEEMDNKLERIKSDTHNLNRIACLSNSEQIVRELWKAVGNSEVRAAILAYTKEEISSQDLVEKLGIKPQNLAKNMRPFLGNKGIIAELKRGYKKFYQRSELVDLVGFDEEADFKKLVESWENKQSKEKEPEDSSPKEETGAI